MYVSIYLYIYICTLKMHRCAFYSCNFTYDGRPETDLDPLRSKVI